MKAIVNVNQQWGIGNNNKLLCSFPEDFNRFKEITMGKAIVYGRKTLLSFPEQKPLPYRTNIVISTSKQNIPVESKKACDYYAYIDKKVIQGKDIGITGINFNKLSNVPKNKLRTSLILITNINIMEDVGMFLGHPSDDIIICGGSSIYNQLLPMCDTVYVTKNNYNEIEPDSYFPNLDINKDWLITNRTGELESTSGITYEFLTYERKINL